MSAGPRVSGRTPARTALTVVGGLLAAVALVGVGVLLGSGREPPGEPLGDLDTRGALEDVPDGPYEVIGETVRLGEGFGERHQHGGPTFNRIVSGRVRLIEDDGSVEEFGPGGFFFEPADRPHVIEVLEDVRIDVVRLVPEGREPTTALD